MEQKKIVEAYPLKYPRGWERTKKPIKSRFDRSFTSIRYDLFNELKLMGVKNIVLSSNLELRRDGLPYSNKKEPEDKGVAVYFTRDGKEQCIPCDKWDKVRDNIQAIVKTIGALRGLERWGAKDMVDAAFRGFQALPHYVNSESFNVEVTKRTKKYFKNCFNMVHLREEYKSRLKEVHPDLGGTEEEFIEVKKQYEEAKRSFN